MNAKIMLNLATILFFAASGIYIGMIYGQYSHGHGINTLNVILCVVFLFLGFVMSLRAQNLRTVSQVKKATHHE